MAKNDHFGQKWPKWPKWPKMAKMTILATFGTFLGPFWDPKMVDLAIILPTPGKKYPFLVFFRVFGRFWGPKKGQNVQNGQNGQNDQNDHFGQNRPF